MSLEAGDGFISGLVATNPVGATDPKSQGDDHLRLIKVAVKGTFPNLTGAVTATQTELNYVDGVTSAIQTQLDLKATATALNASNLTSGTVPDARFPATLPAISGVNLTALNATQLTSGSVPDARLSANVPLINAANTFTLNQAIAHASDPALLITDTGTVETFLQSYGTASIGLTGTNSNHDFEVWTNGLSRMVFESDGNYNFKAGTVTTSNTSASEVGKRGSPAASDETPVLADAGHTIIATGNVTVPANASVAFPAGTFLSVLNNTGGAITIAVTSDTLVLAGTGTTGTRTLASTGFATLYKYSSTGWVIFGTGLS